MDAPPVITIDGPTASGKGTVAIQVAEVLRFHYLDSGLLYRIVAFYAQQEKISLTNERALVEIAQTMQPRFLGGDVWVGSRNIGIDLRTERCGNDASRVAIYKEVRDVLLVQQRKYRQYPGLVADGRDMGTVVFPDAILKIFLTATAMERAKRRYNQLIEKGLSANLDSLVEEVEERDRRDVNRAVSPLIPAEGAVLLDSTGVLVEDVVDQIIRLFKAKWDFRGVV